jgi:hypothetical protein
MQDGRMFATDDRHTVPILRLYVSKDPHMLTDADHHSDHRTYTIPSCECCPLAKVLVEHGLFPTAPSQPRIAVSIALLEFYRALFEQSCDAVTALSRALQTIYAQRGFPLLNSDVSTSVSCSYTHS